MLRLAAQEADGVITTNVPLSHFATLASAFRSDGGKRIVAWLAVCPTEDADAVRTAARPALAPYLVSPAYAELARRLGWEPDLDACWSAWAAGDRRSAVAAIPDHVVDALVLHGSPSTCRAAIDAYGAAGATEVALAVHPPIVEPLRALEAIAAPTPIERSVEW
jgi:alkanesulfonate monooxygenase SsuD/methylene tetrahydromethanopterin reductase-like flavin-dependent oxidoreductase (luciferase family)